MKLPKNLKNLRDALNAIEKSPTKLDLDLYLLAGDKKKVRLVRTSKHAHKAVVGDMHPGSAVYAMADVSVRFPIGKGFSVCVPLCDVPAIAGQLNEALNKALVLSEQIMAEEAKKANAAPAPVVSSPTE